jgi:hypothetical protein
MAALLIRTIVPGGGETSLVARTDGAAARVVQVVKRESQRSEVIQDEQAVMLNRK